MNKAILIPIKPIWCEKIMNRDKLIEVRKNKALYTATKKLIEEQGYATFFMYCTKDKNNTLISYEHHLGDEIVVRYDTTNDKHFIEFGALSTLNGKVVAMFAVRKVDEIKRLNMAYRQYLGEGGFSQLCKDSCLTFEELDKYLGFKNGYAYHIEDLVIFDKPKELNDFIKWYDILGNNTPTDILPHFRLTKAPQNFCYVESEE